MRRPSYLLMFIVAAFLAGAAFVFKYHMLGEAANDDELFRRLLAGAVFVTAALAVRITATFLRAGKG